MTRRGSGGRPLRTIVRTVLREVPLARGGWLWQNYDVMSCGHELIHRPEANKNGRRRCARCRGPRSTT